MRTLLDIGCNVGGYSLYFPDKFDRFVLVDANNEAIEEAKKKQYGGEAVFLNFAVGAGASKTLFLNSGSVLSSTSQKWKESSRFKDTTWTGTTVVPAISLQSLVDDYEPSFIKIDIEGSDLEAIKTLAKKTCSLCFEYVLEFTKDTILAIEYLSSLGYTQFSIEKGDYPLLESNWKSLEDAIYTLKDFNSKNKDNWGMVNVK